ncbi:hypothetical protein BBP40_004444 [Aspergillus hancockii]|nr:hypothetical protein BBP40_004444 [Aspergillus hancockii]
MQLKFLWVDTCCVESKNERCAAVNCEYSLYSNAEVCFAYLHDVKYVPKWDPNNDAERSSWFRRGWTICELVASREIIFFAKDWQVLGRKSELCPQLARYTGIDERVLRDRKYLAKISAAQRMTWALYPETRWDPRMRQLRVYTLTRETRLEEDMAYCLMGLFSVNMPLKPKEGFPAAFRRLQAAIILQHPYDTSILAWKRDRCHNDTRVLAGSLTDFKDCDTIVNQKEPTELTESTDPGMGRVQADPDKNGVFIKLPVTPVHPTLNTNGGTHWANLNCHEAGPGFGNIAVELRLISHKRRCDRTRFGIKWPPGEPAFGRAIPNQWFFIDYDGQAFWCDKTPASHRKAASPSRSAAPGRFNAGSSRHSNSPRPRRSHSPQRSASPGQAGRHGSLDYYGPSASR